MIEVGDVVTASEINSREYGAYVTNYQASNGSSVNWRIYHADDDNIYLIADDYVEDQYWPKYAIGGPTLELFTESYNATHSTDIDIMAVYPLENISLFAGIEANGYFLKWNYFEQYGESIEGIDTDDTLYIISDITKNVVGYWIASPATNDYIYAAGGDGVIVAAPTSTPMIGARPIVVLNSDVKIEKQENGTYLIVE